MLEEIERNERVKEREARDEEEGTREKLNS